MNIFLDVDLVLLTEPFFTNVADPRLDRSFVRKSEVKNNLVTKVQRAINRRILNTLVPSLCSNPVWNFHVIVLNIKNKQCSVECIIKKNLRKSLFDIFHNSHLDFYKSSAIIATQFYVTLKKKSDIWLQRVCKCEQKEN